jgi:hypothetical protein
MTDRLAVRKPNVRKTIVDPTTFCAIVEHDTSPGSIWRVCAQPVAVMVVENGLPVGLCVQHSRDSQRGAA